MRNFSLIDNVLNEADKALRTIFSRPSHTRPNPASDVQQDQPLSERDRKLSGRLMRINHAGEIAAQGLYQGQAIMARDPALKEKMQQSSEEENDHLAWCDQRIEELDTHTSYLGPAWYFGAYTIGAIAGFTGDRWSLGFIQETERQVVHHLDKHLQRLPGSDAKSHSILNQMKIDEAHHAHVAGLAGAKELPAVVKGLMVLSSKVMTSAASRI